MPATPWRLDKGVARLHVDRLSAAIDLAHPADGLVEVCWDTDRLPGARLLGIAAVAVPADDSQPLPGCYVRGADLATTFDRSPGHPLRIDATWRVLTSATADGLVAGVELVVSVQTLVLDCQPDLVVQTSLPATETLRLADAESVEFQPTEGSPETPMDMCPAEGPGCLVFRLPNVESSYAEMIHPADFRRSRLTGNSDEGGQKRIGYDLFSGSMEKGVILRARLRGVLVPRRDDTHVAAAHYRAFAASEPPLGV